MKAKVKAKKHLGQHFLSNQNIAREIAESIKNVNCPNILEIGPGMGMLTQFLKPFSKSLKAIEIDEESVDYLINNNILGKEQVILGDFINDTIDYFDGEAFIVIGNFPYNISSQIMFKVLESKDKIPCVAGMFQKEVAMRLVSGPGNKDYGILSVLLQLWYDGKYLFTVDEQEFNPPPKVKSGVIIFQRNTRTELPIDESLFKKVVKTAFNQRRKTLRNSLRIFNIDETRPGWSEFANLRPEQLNVEQFISLSKLIFQNSDD